MKGFHDASHPSKIPDVQIMAWADESIFESYYGKSEYPHAKFVNFEAFVGLRKKQIQNNILLLCTHLYERILEFLLHR